MTKSHYSLYLILFFSIFSCSDKKEKQQETNPAFTEYIEAFTGGEISNQSNIEIHLTKEVTNLEEVKKIGNDLFDFEPKIEGAVVWKDKRTVVFEPSEILKSAQEYEVQFQLSEIVSVPESLETLHFQCTTRQQFISTEFNGIEVYDPKDLSKQKLSGKVLTSDYADSKALEGLFFAKQEGLNLKMNWEHNADGKEHQFTIENITRNKKESQIQVQWSGEAIGSHHSGTKKIKIPSLSNFSLFSMSLEQKPEQCIIIHFSDPLDTEQDLNGLIYLNNNIPLRLDIQGSVVKAYPTQPVVMKTSLNIERGIRNTMGTQLRENYERSIVFESMKPQIELIGNGVIVPTSSGMHFPFRAVNLSGVNVKILQIYQKNMFQFLQENRLNGSNNLNYVGRIVYKKAIKLRSDKAIDYSEWNNFNLDLSKFIETDTGAMYRVQLSFDKAQSLYPCDDDDVEEETVAPFEEDLEERKFEQPGYYYESDDDRYNHISYNWNDRDNPCKNTYYRQSQRKVSHNVLASDIGIIVKSASDNKLFVSVAHIETTDPMSKVEIEAFDLQHRLLGSAKTNNEGQCVLPLDRKPFLLIAKKGTQRGYLRLDDGSSLSLSMFDVGGEKNKQGIKGYIYTERGVWRPGDSIYVSFVLEDKNHVIPKDHPVVFELFDPNNQHNQRIVATSGLNGFYDFRTKTKQDDITGNWLAKVRVGGASFSKTLRIETVKPNRLKMDLSFGRTPLMVGKNNANLSVKWLHGAKGKGLRSTVELTLSKGKTTFPGLPDYQFDDPSKNFQSKETMLFDSNVNQEGVATIVADFAVKESAPGMLKAKFRTRAFETSGDFSTDLVTVAYSPFDSYAGVKIPKGKGWNGALFSDETNIIPIATVDSKGNPVDRKRVKIEVYSIGWRWWWENSGTDNLAHYVANEKKSLIKRDYVNTVNGKAMYSLTFDEYTWGRKLIRVTDPVSGHSTGKLFYSDYKGWWDQNEDTGPGGAEMLTFTTNKKRYNVGEKVQVELPSAEKARALVSVESGSKVIETFWTEVNKEQHSFEFETTAEMAPNVYVHVTLLQPHKQTANNLPIRMYGIQSIEVQDSRTHLHPELSMPDELKPNEEVSLTVKERDGLPMTYTIALVDEGLLDLTRFKTPNAWSEFYKREALGVKSWDLYTHILGAFSGEMAGLLAIGGDEDLIGKDGKKANRFESVVKMLGPFELTKGSHTHTITLPNYIGSVRTMVVAGMEGAYGSTEKTTPVKKPLMVLATLPRVVGPSESVSLPISVFAMDDTMDDVEVRVRANNAFRPLVVSEQEINFDEVGEKTIYFDLKVAEKLGIGTIDVEVECNGETAQTHVELDVRMPNPPLTKGIDAVIDPGETWTSNYKAIGMLGTNTGTVEFSTLPPLNLKKRLSYLIQYPHGCVEQTTSSVFPQLYLNNLVELTLAEKQQVEIHIKEGIEQLRRFQQSNGGLSYWPGTSGTSNSWGTSYAGHFMLEAKGKGYAVSNGFLKKWSTYQTRVANRWKVQDYDQLDNKNRYTNYHAQLDQAYRLYTLALANRPAMGAMNRMREMQHLSLAGKWRLAGAYALVGRESIAKALLENMSTNVPDYTQLSETFGSSLRDEAMILETLSALGEREKGKYLLKEISSALASEHWHSTQSTSWALLSVAKYLGESELNEPMNYNLTLKTKQSVNTTMPIVQQELNLEENPNGTVTVENIGKKILFAKIQLQGTPIVGEESAEENNLTLSVLYTDGENKAIDVTKIKQGTDFRATVTVKHPGIRSNYKELALTQIFPSGWEIRNIRLETDTSEETKSQANYQDIRDDRIYTYFDLKRGETKEFTVILNASYAGKYYLSGPSCEAMYDGTIQANGKGEWVEVEK